MEFTPENVENAVIEFYRQQSELNINCHEWLKQCQVSLEAWQLVWPLLEPSKDVQIQFVAANMLYHKIAHCLQEVPETEFEVLKDKVIATLIKYVANSGPHVIVTKLQLTLGALITNSIGPRWPNPLEDLGSIFQPQSFPGIPQEDILKLLIQTYSSVPEQTRSIWQHSFKKGETYRAVQDKGESMFAWLFNIVQTQQNPELTLEALKAMSSWMSMLRLSEWSQIKDLVSSLVNLCNKAILSSDDLVCDVTLEIINGIIADSMAYPNLILTILDKVLPLQSCLDILLQRQDMELASSLFGIYVVLGDCHSKLVVEVCDEESSYNKDNSKNRTNVLALIDILLKCTGTPGFYPIDELVSPMTITVWYSIVEDLQSTQSGSDSLKYGRLMQVFEWVYKSLAEILIRKSQYPEDESSWSSDEKEQFRTYRQDVGDCLTYCFELRGWTMLNELITLAEKDIQLIEEDTRNYSKLWTELEALLNGIRVVIENISDETDPLVVVPMKRVFEVIYRVLKFNREIPVPKVYQSAVDCISACSVMLQSYDGVAKNLITFILDGLFVTEVVSTATLALKSLSRDCAKQLVEFAPQILASCKSALDGGKLSQNDCIRLVYCVGKFLPYLPQDQILTGVNEIFAPSVQILHSIANQPVKAELKSQLVAILHIMSTLCSSLDSIDSDDEEQDDGISEGETKDNNNSSQDRANASVQPLIPVVEQILPILVPVAEKWSRDEEVMEALFSILKHTITTIHTRSSTVVQYGIQLILISYRLYPCAAATTFAKQIILMLGPENLQTQCQLLQEMHSSCSETMKKPRDNLDFADSYFIFIGQLVKNNTHLVNQAGIKLDLLLAIATEALNFSENRLLRSAIYFLQITIDKAAVLRPSLVEYFRLQGLHIIQKILLGIGSFVPRASVVGYAEVFLSLNRCLAEDWRKWLQEALAPSDFPSIHCTADDKNKFYCKITKERVTKRTLQEAIGDFAVACRNLSGSDYAAMTSKRI